MGTEYVRLTEEKREKALERAAEVIKTGGLVAFPTETVYGLGGNGLNSDSAKKIYKAKGRPSDNPLILHISDFSMLSDLVKEIPKSAKILAEKFWPGPMTLVFKKSNIVPLETSGGLETVAVRLPSHEVARDLIRRAKLPIAAPSANSSGRPSPTAASHVREDLDGKIDMILDGGEVGIGIESTIIDVTGETPVLLRPGFITKEMIEEILGEIAVDPTILGGFLSEEVRPKAPGMKYRHYAPKGSLVIYEGENLAVMNRINLEAEKAREDGFVTAIIATEETRPFYKGDFVFSVGRKEDANQIGHNLFAVLRKADEVGAERIYSESFGKDDFFVAIMNRLNKAAGFQKIKVD